MAAGALMIREAGGLVGDLDGDEKYLESGRIVAANAKLFSPLLQLLKQPG
jgi:myo-inositol-1(or 4)-monophosphatase